LAPLNLLRALKPGLGPLSRRVGRGYSGLWPRRCSHVWILCPADFIFLGAGNQVRLWFRPCPLVRDRGLSGVIVLLNPPGFHPWRGGIKKACRKNWPMIGGGDYGVVACGRGFDSLRLAGLFPIPRPGPSFGCKTDKKHRGPGPSCYLLFSTSQPAGDLAFRSFYPLPGAKGMCGDFSTGRPPWG